MKDDKGNTIFELGLLRKDKIANIIFTLGVTAASLGLNQREQSIIQTGRKQFLNHASTISEYNLEKSFVLANWIYLISGIIFISTATTSLEEKISTEPMNASLSSEKSINGSKMVVLGNISKIIGYILTALGREITAGSIMKHKHDKNKNLFQLGLIQKNKAANLLFLLGVTVSFTGLNQRELSIKQSETKQFLNQESNISKYNFEKSIALANWIYLMAGIIYNNTSSASLQEIIATRPKKASLSREKNIGGSKMVVDGTLFKVIGYLSSALGRETIANSTIDSDIIINNTVDSKFITDSTI
jgi:hypothetical protein